MKWICVFVYVRIRARWIGPYAWRNVRNQFRGCFVCISLVDVALLQPRNTHYRKQLIHRNIVRVPKPKNKNPLFALQKPYFCNVKTPFLHAKNHTFTRRICNTQITNTLRTLHKCVSNGLQMCPNVLRMCGEHVYTGTINRSPTAADNLPIMLLTDCNNTTFKTQKQPPF